MSGVRHERYTKRNVVTEYTELSAFSAQPKECDHHLIFGSGLRKLADEDGLILPLTNYEHNIGSISERIHDNIAAEKLSKMLGQVAFEKEFYRSALESLQEINEGADPAREMFRERYGISYL